MILSAPIAAWIAGRSLNLNSASLALLLSPVVTGVASISSDHEGSDRSLHALLWPGLAGIAGLLLLVPQPALSGVRAWAGLFALPLTTAVGATVYSAGEGRSTPDCDSRDVPPLALLVAGLYLGLTQTHASLHGSWTLFRGGTAIDACLLLLSLYALGLLGAVQWSAQFLVTPLLAVLESLVLLRPRVDFRSWAGLALLLVGAVSQVWPAADNSNLRLLSLRSKGTE